MADSERSAPITFPGTVGMPTIQAPDIGAGMTTAALQGAQMAHYNEQVQAQRAQLDLQKQQHQMMAADKYLDTASKIGRVRNPGAQKALFNVMQQVYPMAVGQPGAKLDPEAFNFYKDEDLGVASAAKQMYDSALSGKPVDQQTWQTFLDAHQGDPSKFPDFVERMTHHAMQAQTGQQNAAAMVGAKEYAAKLQAQTAAAAQTGANVRAGVNPSVASDSYIAKHEAGRIAQQKAESVAATNAQKAASAGKATAETGVVQQNANARSKTADAAMLRASKTGAASEERIKQGYVRINSAAENQIASDLKPIRNTVFAADKGLALLNKPDITYGEVKEALIDYTRALTQGGQNSQNREAGLSDGYFTLSDSVNKLIGKYITNNPKDNKVNADTIGLLRGDLQNLSNTTKAQFETVARTRLENKRASGIHPEVIDKFYTNYGLKPPGSGQPAMSFTPGSGAPSAAPAPAAPNVDAVRAQAQAAIKAGAPADAVQKMFGDKLKAMGLPEQKL